MTRGRKPNPNRKIQYGTRLRPDQVEWLRSRKNAAKSIERALDAFRELQEMIRYNREETLAIIKKYETR